MPDTQTFVIVGAGLAGAKAAEHLREEGFGGRIVLIGAEPELPYERPPLSKDYLRGESARTKTRVHEDGFYADNAIDLRTGTTAERLDPRASEVLLAGGERLRYDRLLLATGSERRRAHAGRAGTDRGRRARETRGPARHAAAGAAAVGAVLTG